MRSRPSADCAYSPIGSDWAWLRWRRLSGRDAAGTHCPSRTRRCANCDTARQPGRAEKYSWPKSGALRPNAEFSRRHEDRRWELSGRRSSAPGSSRSQAMVSMPCAASSGGQVGIAESGYRDHAPLHCQLYLTRGAPDGPGSDPSSRPRRGSAGRLSESAIAATSASRGRESNSSSSVTF